MEEWATGGATDIDKLTFACTGHHKLLDHGWTAKTRQRRHPMDPTISQAAPTPTTTPNGCSAGELANNRTRSAV